MSIEERRTRAGDVAYRVRLRRGGQSISGTFETRAEAVAFRAAALAALKTGAKLPTPPRQAPRRPPAQLRAVTVADAAQELVEGMLSGAVRDNRGRAYKPATIDQYERRLRLHVLPRIGALPLAALRRGDVRRLVDDLAVEVGAATAALCRDTLRVVFRLQIDREVLETNPCAGVKAPSRTSRPARFLTAREADSLQAAADADLNPEAAPLVALALATGARRNELRALLWGRDGLDLDRGVVVISATWGRSGPLETKTRKGRTIPLDGAVVGRMRRWRLASGRPDDGAPVLRGNPWQAWNRVRRSAGLEPPLPRMHDLRHTAATFWLAAGLRSHAVAELLGHEDAGLVDRLYGHVLPSELASAGAALEAWRRAQREA